MRWGIGGSEAHLQRFERLIRAAEAAQVAERVALCRLECRPPGREFSAPAEVLGVVRIASLQQITDLALSTIAFAAALGELLFGLGETSFGGGAGALALPHFGKQLAEPVNHRARIARASRAQGKAKGCCKRFRTINVAVDVLLDLGDALLRVAHPQELPCARSPPFPATRQLSAG